MKRIFKTVVASFIAMMVFVPVVKAEGEPQEITEINITLDGPKVGDVVSKVDKTCSYTIPAEYSSSGEDEVNEYPCPYYSPSPAVTTGENTYAIGDGGRALWIKKLPSEVTVDPSNYEAFDAEMQYTAEELQGLTFEADKEYGVEIYLEPKEGYIFAENLVIKVNGKTTGFELSEWNGAYQTMLYTKVKAVSETTTTEEETPATETTTGSETTTTTGSETAATTATTAETKKIEVLNGADQKFDATGKDRLTFRFNLDYSKFKESGKVFVDGKEVDSKNYESKEGSTIIIFTKSFTNKLKAGNHEMKLTSNEGEATTTFAVTNAVKNPQTGDNIMTYVALAIISGLSLVYVTKKRFN